MEHAAGAGHLAFNVARDFPAPPNHAGGRAAKWGFPKKDQQGPGFLFFRRPLWEMGGISSACASIADGLVLAAAWTLGGPCSLA